MEIRITKKPPAPLMDGFDLRRFQLGRVYVVEDLLGRYLTRAGYAEPATPSAANMKVKAGHQSRRSPE